MYQINGHHHTSMMTKNAQENNHFYTRILGLRRVKMTVNQDTPSMYHLFYGDRTGSPGTELTFFEMPQIGQTHRGTNAITRIGLMVLTEASLTYWQERLRAHGVMPSNQTMYANRSAVHFEDKDGLRLVLLAARPGEAEQMTFENWKKSPVPAEHQVMGMGPVELTVRRLEKMTHTLTGLFGYTEVSRAENEAIFQSIEGEVAGEIVVREQDGPRERPGRGSVHHLAIRAANEEELIYWDEQVRQRGFESTGILDRYYFKSLYFRESNGILFEIATDGPGFMIDSEEATLGETLDLPPFLEKKREEIEASLTPMEEEK